MDTKTIIMTFLAFIASFAITFSDTSKINKNNDLLAFKHENILWYDLGKYEQIAEIEQQITQNYI